MPERIVSSEEWTRLSKQRKLKEYSANNFDDHTKKAAIAFVVGFITMPVSPVMSLIMFGEMGRQVMLANKTIDL